MIKVRFAPSPTGYLHIGGARTALFNWLYARAQGGSFVLRVEDTDRERSKDIFLDEILQSMEWLGFHWDELYKQSERFDIYLDHAQKLIQEGHAYRDGEAVLLSMPNQEIKLYDLIRGEISFDTSLLKDEVLIKSDRSPTYSFACVVDDALMGISHVIRGEDHISNTPKQLMIYQALGLKPPKFAHLPLIMGEDGGRMSKRTGAVAVTDYKRQGFIPEALVNYLLLLGWSPGSNQEKIDLKTATKKFSIKHVQKSPAIFSLDKLTWLNAQYIKQMNVEDITDLLVPFLQEKGYLSKVYDRKILENSVELYQSRMPRLLDFCDRADFLFKEQIDLDDEIIAKLKESGQSQSLVTLAERLTQISTFSPESTEKVFREVVKDLGLQSAELVHPVRMLLTGKTIGPGLFETMSLVGKDKTLERLRYNFNI